MNRSVTHTLAICALIGAAVGQITGAQAQNAAAPAIDPAAPQAMDAAPAVANKAKPKPHRVMARNGVGKPAFVSVNVVNMRAVALIELNAAAAGGGPSAVILDGLAPGKKAIAKVAHGKDCLFDLHGAYEDGSTTDVPGIDLCKEKKLTLVE